MYIVHVQCTQMQDVTQWTIILHTLLYMYSIHMYVYMYVHKTYMCNAINRQGCWDLIYNVHVLKECRSVVLPTRDLHVPCSLPDL